MWSTSFTTDACLAPKWTRPISKVPRHEWSSWRYDASFAHASKDTTLLLNDVILWAHPRYMITPSTQAPSSQAQGSMQANKCAHTI